VKQRDFTPNAIDLGISSLYTDDVFPQRNTTDTDGPLQLPGYPGIGRDVPPQLVQYSSSEWTRFYR